jgi:cytochrome c-type biogenesis protein CcmH
MMAERLAARLRSNRTTRRVGRCSVGRTPFLGQFPQARQAYRRVIDLRPQDAQARADYADASAMANGGKLDGEPEKAIERALQLDPDNAKALSLAGTLALRRGDAALAASHWERALRTVEPGSEMATQIQAALTEARQRYRSRLTGGVICTVAGRALQTPGRRLAAARPWWLETLRPEDRR